jgi:hypothetical protein
MRLLANAHQSGHMHNLHGSRLRTHISRAQLRAVAIHKEYSKGGLKDKPPSNVLLATPEGGHQSCVHELAVESPCVQAATDARC